MCVLSIKVPIRKKSGNLFNDLRIFKSWGKNYQWYGIVKVEKKWSQIVLMHIHIYRDIFENVNDEKLLYFLILFSIAEFNQYFQ